MRNAAEGTLAPLAATIGDALLSASPAFVSEAQLEHVSGLCGYAVRWYIYQLRQAGFVIQAAMTGDRVAFAQGARGWRLVDVGAAVPATVACDPVEPRQGMRVEHFSRGRGRVAFVRAGFPSVVVVFADGSRESVTRDSFVRTETGVVYALSD